MRRPRPESHAVRAAAGAYSRASRRRKPLLARSTRICRAIALVFFVTGSAAAQDGAARCDGVCAAAAELVERFELREGASPVRERAGWTAPKRIVVADVPLADYLRTIAPGVEI